MSDRKKYPLSVSVVVVSAFLCVFCGGIGSVQQQSFSLIETARAEKNSGSDSPSSSPTTIGTADATEENILRISLRRESSLLRKGQIQFEMGIDYLRSKNETGSFFEETSRKVSLPLSLRLGIFENLNGFLAIPLTYSNREVSVEGDEITDDTINLGDLTVGFSGQLLAERYSWPEIIATVQYLEPTGTDPYGDEGTQAETGSGHRAVTGGIQFIKTSDPIVLFGGISYLHQFETRALGQDIQPGGTIEFNLGLSFAANDDLSISGQAIGSYQADLELDGEKLDGTSEEPYFIRFAVTSRWIAGTFLEPSVTLGLNDDADFYRFGLAIIRRWN
ncbi:MAG: hypothetical protein R6V46_10130 [Desulfatiglandaceae bacterium]